MKKWMKGTMLALTIALTTGVGVTAYAEGNTSDSVTNNNSPQIERKLEAIDKAVEEGKISAEKAEQIKEKMTNNIDKFGQNFGKGNFDWKKGKRPGKGIHQEFGPKRMSVRDILVEDFGLTEDQLKEARDNDKTLLEVLEENNISVEDVKSTLLNKRIEAIDKAVEEGKFTAERAEQMKENITENMTNFGENFGKGNFDLRKGKRPGKGMHQRFSGNFMSVRDILVEDFGLTEDQLIEARDNGKTMLEVLEENNISVEDVQSTLLNKKIEAIDKAVEEGKITVEKAEQMKENITENMSNMLERMENGDCDFGSGMNRQNKPLNKDFDGKGSGRQKGAGQGMMKKVLELEIAS
jgi:polyhydroxyalkanoate synthesis regulator phasin